VHEPATATKAIGRALTVSSSEIATSTFGLRNNGHQHHVLPIPEDRLRVAQATDTGRVHCAPLWRNRISWRWRILFLLP